MAVRYLCVYCEVPFEAEGAEKPRCPKCMRVHGVKSADAPATKGVGRSRVVAIVAAATAVCGVLGWYAYARWGRPAGLAAGVVSGSAANGAVEAFAKDADPRVARAAELFAANDAIEAFAERATEGQSAALDRARAVVKALRARAAAEAFVRWPLVDPRREPTLDARGALDAVAKDQAKRRLYPLEVAALAVSALRAVDVPARLAEVFRFEGERVPPDPSGRLGYFLVAITGANRKVIAYLDPYGGRAAQPLADDVVLLEDAEAVGAALGVEAVSLIARNGDPAHALACADAAVKLAPRSPSVRVARGTVLLANAGVAEGTRELEAAAQLRDDGPRHHALAVVALASGDRERALREISLALERTPDYAAAQVTLALLELSRLERDQARATLEQAERLEPALPGLALAWAHFHASSGEIDQAITRALGAAEQDPSAIEPHLLLAGLYRQAARYDELRAEVRTALGLVPPARRARTEEMIRRMFGPAALEDAPSAVGSAGSAVPLAGATGADGAGKLRLLDEELGGGAAAGGLKLGDDAPKLRLREPGQRLELDRP